MISFMHMSLKSCRLAFYKLKTGIILQANLVKMLPSAICAKMASISLMTFMCGRIWSINFMNKTPGVCMSKVYQIFLPCLSCFSSSSKVSILFAGVASSSSYSTWSLSSVFTSKSGYTFSTNSLRTLNTSLMQRFSLFPSQVTRNPLSPRLISSLRLDEANFCL